MHGMGPVRDFENLAPAAHARDGPRPRLRKKARRGEGVAHPLPAMNPRMRNNRVFVLFGKEPTSHAEGVGVPQRRGGEGPVHGKNRKVKGGSESPTLEGRKKLRIVRIACQLS